MSKSLFLVENLLRGTALVGVGALLLLAPRSADACQPPVPGLVDSVPASGEEYPGNAALLFRGYDLSVDNVTVTVDGQPAALVPALLPHAVNALAVVVEPEPQEGQSVSLSGTLCDPQYCSPLALDYTVGSRDNAVPDPSPNTSFFAVYDHVDYVSSGGDCAADSDLTFYVHLEHSIAGQSPVFFHVGWYPEAADQPVVGRTVRADDSQVTAVLSVVSETLAGKDPTQDVCLRVLTFDAAGNESAPYELCPACYFRKDDIVHGFSTPEEPVWTDDEAVPGSACSDEPPTTEGSETEGTTDGTETTEPGTTEPTTGDPPTSGSASDGSSDSSSDGDGGSDGGSDTAGPGASGQSDGCSCNSDGDTPGDFGRFLLFVLGLGFGVIKRRR